MEFQNLRDNIARVQAEREALNQEAFERTLGIVETLYGSYGQKTDPARTLQLENETTQADVPVESHPSRADQTVDPIRLGPLRMPRAATRTPDYCSTVSALAHAGDRLLNGFLNWEEHNGHCY